MLDRLGEWLVCPDDRGELSKTSSSFQCTYCGRKFSIYADNFVEVLPSKRYPLEAKTLPEQLYVKYYQQLAEAPFEWNPKATGWGYLPHLPVGHRLLYLNERELVGRLLPSHLKVLCDITGGVGNYTLYFADRAEVIVHCDLDVNNLNHALRRAKEAQMENVCFVRCDYLYWPFAQEVFDCIMCLDTFERGEVHDGRLLEVMSHALKPGGQLIMDFHNRNHRLPFRPERTMSYRRGRVREMLQQAGLQVVQMFPLGCLPGSLVRWPWQFQVNKVLTFFLPPTRYVVLAQK